MSTLPFIDEHSQPVNAGADTVWTTLVRVLGSFTNERFAGLLGCSPNRRSGNWFAAGDDLAGATLAGFRVTIAEHPARLELRGSHHFSSYALVFLIDDQSIRAQSYGAFPGLRGRLYRAGVIGSGAHRVIVRRLLKRVAAASESARSAS